MNLDFTKLDGLVATVVQDHKTNRVLMVGFMNEEAWRKTAETGFVHITFDRSGPHLVERGRIDRHPYWRE